LRAKIHYTALSMPLQFLFSWPVPGKEKLKVVVAV